jgi:hypothetical protein
MQAAYFYERNQYLVTADGQRFPVETIARDQAVTSITLVLNWTTLLKK